jgi:hypothetical protein
MLRSVVHIQPGRSGYQQRGAAHLMFGRRRREAPDTTAQVDVHLEWDVDAVRQAVIAFLQDPGDSSRQALIAALERLDSQIELGDAYSESVLDSSFFGQAPKGTILGETSSHSMAEEVPGVVLRAQIALVREAKSAIRGPNPGTLQDLRTASASLASAINKSHST